MRFSNAIFSFLTLSSLVLTSCGDPTGEEIVSQYQSDLEEKRSHLEAIIANLPTEPLQGESKCPTFDPPFVMGAGVENNAGLVMEEQLSDPSASPSFTFSDAFAFTKPFLILKELEEGSEKATWVWTNFEAKVKEIIDYDYLVIYRITEHIPSKTIDSDSFSMGSIKMDVFIASFETNQILCSYQISATTDEHVKYEYENESDKTHAILSAANNSLGDNIEKAAKEKLKEVTGYPEIYFD